MYNLKIWERIFCATIAVIVVWLLSLLFGVGFNLDNFIGTAIGAFGFQIVDALIYRRRELGYFIKTSDFTI